MTTLHFSFPMPENLTNASSGRSHWRTKHGAKQKYLSVCDAMQSTGLLPPPPKQPWEKATISSVMRLGGAMDDDNAMARHKWPLDWLRTRGYIVEDRQKNITWLALPTQIVKRDRKYGIEITLSLLRPLLTQETP